MIRSEGLVQNFGVLRTLSRMVRDAARAEAPFLRVRDACFGYLVKCDMPVSKGPMTLADSSKSASKQDPTGHLQKIP